MPFAGGTGTDLDPYLISTPNQLNDIRTGSNLGKSYKLINDIDLDVSPYNNGDGWLPIDYFYGKIDGNGFKIKNLFIILIV